MQVSRSSYFLLLLLALIWGSSFILMKEGLRSLDLWQLASLRISIAGLVLLPFIQWKNLNINKKDIKLFFLSGMLGNGIPAFLFAAAQTKLSSSLTGALNSLTPLFVLFVGLAFMGVAFDRYKLWGVIVGLIGALMLIFSKGFQLAGNDLSFIGLIILAALCYGTNVNIIKYKLGHYPPLVVAAIPLAMVSVLTLIILAVIGVPTEFSSVAVQRSLGAVVLLAILGTSLSLYWFNQLIQRTNAVFASSVTYLIPVVALAWGWLDGEHITMLQVAGLAIVLIAIGIVNRSRI